TNQKVSWQSRKVAGSKSIAGKAAQRAPARLPSLVGTAVLHNVWFIRGAGLRRWGQPAEKGDGTGRMLKCALIFSTKERHDNCPAAQSIERPVSPGRALCRQVGSSSRLVVRGRLHGPSGRSRSGLATWPGRGGPAGTAGLLGRVARGAATAGGRFLRSRCRAHQRD